MYCRVSVLSFRSVGSSSKLGEAEVIGYGEGIPPPTGLRAFGRGCGPSQIVWDFFYPKMACCGAFKSIVLELPCLNQQVSGSGRRGYNPGTFEVLSARSCISVSGTFWTQKMAVAKLWYPVRRVISAPALHKLREQSLTLLPCSGPATRPAAADRPRARRPAALQTTTTDADRWQRAIQYGPIRRANK